MRPEDLRAFAARDWAAIAAHKQSYWIDQVEERGPLGALRAADALREHAAHFLSAAAARRARAEDLAHHIEVKKKIDAAGRAFGR
ncbi:MAG: hypothetical protein WKG00_16230 [Polyangiaceae bacterium]